MNKVIYNYTLCHLFLFIVAEAEVIGCFSHFRNNPNEIKIIISLIISIFEVFFILVFLEIIELNFCGLQLNTKRNIQIRADMDILNIYSEDEFEDDPELSGKEKELINHSTL